MKHPIYRVVGLHKVRAYTLRVTFDDGTDQVIDFSPVLIGQVYGPLRDKRLFDLVQIDPEIHTLVWPNGADFDPATLHDWPACAAAMSEMARSWAAQPEVVVA
jgi:hypothetical protein